METNTQASVPPVVDEEAVRFVVEEVEYEVFTVNEENMFMAKRWDNDELKKLGIKDLKHYRLTREQQSIELDQTMRRSDVDRIMTHREQVPLAIRVKVCLSFSMMHERFGEGHRRDWYGEEVLKNLYWIAGAQWGTTGYRVRRITSSTKRSKRKK